MTSILHDPWTGATVHDDSLPSPVVTNDANGDYIIHRENGKSTYKAYEGGGSELPEVTADDNGDVLTVVDGEWAKAAPSGGGGVLVVEVDMVTMALDKTWQEINDADFPIVKLEDDGYISFCTVATTAYDGNYEVKVFSFTNDDPEHPSTYNVLMIPFVATSADGYPVAQM